jgi:hypothetical protein
VCKSLCVLKLEVIDHDIANFVCRPVISSVHRIMGREALINRLSVEQAFKVAFGEAFGPLGIQVRWLNYTTYRQLPSGEHSTGSQAASLLATTIAVYAQMMYSNTKHLLYLQSLMPHCVTHHVMTSSNLDTDSHADPTSWYGDYRTDFRAIDQQALIYQQPPGASNLTMGSVFNWTTFLQKVVTQQVQIMGSQWQSYVSGVHGHLLKGLHSIRLRDWTHSGSQN